MKNNLSPGVFYWEIFVSSLLFSSYLSFTVLCSSVVSLLVKFFFFVFIYCTRNVVVVYKDETRIQKDWYTIYIYIYIYILFFFFKKQFQL